MSSNSESLARIKRPRIPEELEDCLTCQICCDYFQPPVLQCSKGHSLCVTCYQRLPKDKHCGMCQAPIEGRIRNYTLEGLLEKVFVECRWDNCEAHISLADRRAHERECEHRPLVRCYFAALGMCSWTGDAVSLPSHLAETHKIQELTRHCQFRYLWNPPISQVWRYRYRLLRLEDTASVYILEHFYSSELRQSGFLVRALTADSRRKYRVSLRDRNHSKLELAGLTPLLSDPTIAEMMHAKADSRVLVVSCSDLESFCFDYQDGQRYFSLHIEFL